MITDKAINYLKNRDKDRPFCMMFHHKAPHRNWMPSPRHLGIFNDTVFPEPENLFDDYSSRCPAASEQDMNLESTFTEDWDLKRYDAGGDARGSGQPSGPGVFPYS